jgi:hypothetical protein
LVFYAPVVRELIEPVGGTAITFTNASGIVEHPYRIG